MHLNAWPAGARDSRASFRHSRQMMAPRWPSITGETPSQSVRQKSQLTINPPSSMRCIGNISILDGSTADTAVAHGRHETYAGIEKKKRPPAKLSGKPAAANDGPYSCREIPGRALPGRWWRTTRRLWVFFAPLAGEELVSVVEVIVSAAGAVEATIDSDAAANAGVEGGV